MIAHDLRVRVRTRLAQCQSLSPVLCIDVNAGAQAQPLCTSDLVADVGGKLLEYHLSGHLRHAVFERRSLSRE